jgi:hypothetical protein
MGSSITSALRQEKLEYSNQGRCVGQGTYESEEEFFLEQPEGKRPLRKPRYRWRNNIELDLRMDSVVWTGLI